MLHCAGCTTKGELPVPYFFNDLPNLLFFIIYDQFHLTNISDSMKSSIVSLPPQQSRYVATQSSPPSTLRSRGGVEEEIAYGLDGFQVMKIKEIPGQ